MRESIRCECDGKRSRTVVLVAVGGLFGLVAAGSRQFVTFASLPSLCTLPASRTPLYALQTVAKTTFDHHRASPTISQASIAIADPLRRL